MDPRTPPNDPVAEQQVLGACMQQPALVETLRLSGADFYRPAHELIWSAIRFLSESGTPCDWAAVHHRLLAAKQLGKAGGVAYLHELVAGAPAAVGFHAAKVADLAGKRRLIEELMRSLQDVYTSEDDHTTLALRTEQRVGKVAGDPTDTDDLMNLDDFLDRDLGPEQWVVPGLLAKEDRLVLTGLEGLGKSILLRQFAVCAAAGIHPFTGHPVEPKNVLLVDTENPERIMIKTLTQMRQAARARGHPVDPNRMWVRRRPAGINLNDPAERVWLVREAATVNVDLLCIGPAYKLYFGGKGEREEDLARIVTNALDQVREATSCAIVLEHHAPHGNGGDSKRDTRPIGSSVWLRWPEFGKGIRPADMSEDSMRRRLVEVQNWKGDRDTRDWPEQLESAGVGMPWVNVNKRRAA